MLCDLARHSLFWVSCTVMKFSSRQRLHKKGKQSILQCANFKVLWFWCLKHCAVHAQYQHALLILTVL